ncbi:MAG TPA: PQQ-binding-like beta-propeller repeat protein [Pirellulales bacterium]|nr:PQQ-binding-like beta-propeller repeat protein [Pirellulales bacterium]
MLFGVIALPVLVPIAALLQLLFPGILREQWRQYQYVVKVLVTQSTVIFVHWALLKWVFKDQPWWLADKYLWGALVAVSAVGMIVAWLHHDRSEPAAAADSKTPAAGAGTSGKGSTAKSTAAKSTAGKSAGKSTAPIAVVVDDGTALRPTSLEFWAVGVLLAAGLGWIAWQWRGGDQPWDQMSIVTGAALIGMLHLLWRRATFVPGRPRSIVTTERLMLTAFVVIGVGLGFYVQRSDANQIARTVTTDWPTFHGDASRSGAADPHDAGPTKPTVKWTFDPAVRKGRIIMDSSPILVSGQLFIGALHEVSASFNGNLFCVNAATGKSAAGKDQLPGERIWTFTAKDTLQPVYSSPIVAGGRLYFGEGFHEDHNCRLFCVDPSQPNRIFWMKQTTSHVESTPTIVGDRIYFGAGDDGVFCLELPKTATEAAHPPEGAKADIVLETPHQAWHFEKIHVDSSPAVIHNRVFIGSILGDVYKSFEAVALDAEQGTVLWRLPADLPVAACPAATTDHAYFGLGNGKVNVNDPKPAGAVWSVNAETGKRDWEFKTENAVFASPIPAGEVVYAVCRDSFCYCLNAANGEVKWKVALGASLVATPILAADKLYVLNTRGALTCLNAETGKILWNFDELASGEDTVYSSPVLVDGNVYLAIDGKVYCIGDADKNHPAEPAPKKAADVPAESHDQHGEKPLEKSSDPPAAQSTK